MFYNLRLKFSRTFNIRSHKTVAVIEFVLKNTINFSLITNCWSMKRIYIETSWCIEKSILSSTIIKKNKWFQAKLFWLFEQRQSQLFQFESFGLNSWKPAWNSFEFSRCIHSENKSIPKSCLFSLNFLFHHAPEALAVFDRTTTSFWK